MKNIAVHMRISGVTINDADVNSRRAATTSLANKWRKESTVSKIVSKALEIAEALGGDGNPSPSLGSEVQGAIQKKSPSFLYEERPLEIGVCAGMAMVSILDGNLGNNGLTIADVYANTLWSILAYQPVLEDEKRENLRQEVLDAAQKWATTSAEKARERTGVPDLTDVKVSVDDSNASLIHIKEAVASTIDALCRNATLDREELDFLWWAQLDRSRLLKKPICTIAEPTRIVAAGIEGASMLRRFPCEVHREIVLRSLDQNPELNLVDLLSAVGNDRTTLSTAFVKGFVADHPAAFPLLHALATGEAAGAGANVKRRVSEWGERALHEAGFARMISQGLAKL